MTLTSGVCAATLLSVIVAFAPLSAKDASDTIRCESPVGGYKHCRATVAGKAVVLEQLSGHACHEDNTWGTDQGGVWVSNGCSAIFWTGKGQPPKKEAPTQKEQSQPQAEARDDGILDNLARSILGDEKATRKRNKDIAESADGAAGAAQAVVAVVPVAAPQPRSAGRSLSAPVAQAPPAAASPRSLPVPKAAVPQLKAKRGAPTLTTCESKKYKKQTCPVPGNAYVELRKELSIATCKFNSTWGYNFGEIWVAEGCRAQFAIY